MANPEQERHDESIIKVVVDAACETIEELTNKIASVFKSDQDDLHDREN